MLAIEDKFTNILPYKTYICLGSFDGLHLGHMQLVYKTIENAKKNNAKSMVFTFKNHPLSVINEKKAPKLIMDNNTKIHILDKMGIDIINLVPFDKDFMNIGPVKFIELLIKYYNIQGLVVGFNYKFGSKNQGDVKLLQSLSKRYNFDLNIIDPVKYDDKVVCSTTIRELLVNGEIEKVNEMLYQRFNLLGKVVKGRHVGHKIGFPTINVDVNKNIIIPKNGVYYTEVIYDNVVYKGITNVGYCPTFNTNNVTIETHILNFNKQIYGEYVKIFFIKRIRDQFKFDSSKQLSLQLQKDKLFAENQIIVSEI